MTSFVTGASGFIGSHLCKHLVGDGGKVIALVRNHIPTRWLKDALEGCIIVRGDVRSHREMLRVISDYEVDEVYHLASHAVVKHAYIDPMNTFETNIMGTVSVLEACRQIGDVRTLVMSTDKCYGDGLNATEESPLVATEPYGTSKVAADLIAQTYRRTYGMNVTVARSCNVYGLDYSNRIIPNTVRNCLKNVSPIIYRGEESLRQYIYVEDCVDALIHTLHKRKPGVYNIASPDVLSQEDVVLRILKFFPHLEPKYVERERRRERIYQQSMKYEPYGIKPKHSFEEGIEKTIELFKEYRTDWWRKK